MTQKITFLLLFVTSFIMSSCSSDDNNMNLNVDNPKNILGEWIVEDYLNEYTFKYNDDETEKGREVLSKGKVTMNFKENGELWTIYEDDATFLDEFTTTSFGSESESFKPREDELNGSWEIIDKKHLKLKNTLFLERYVFSEPFEIVEFSKNRITLKLEINRNTDSTEGKELYSLVLSRVNK